MRHHVIGLLVAAAMLLASAPSARAQAAQTGASREPAPAHDISGLWFGGQGGGVTIPAKVSPLTPAGQARFDVNTAEIKKNLTISADPTFRCEPAGVPHIYGVGGYLMEVLQVPDASRIILFYESVHTFRDIWMDGRAVPEGSDPMWMGWSVGHWEGDHDLVVETTNFNDKTWITSAGYPHSEAMHVTEHFHRVDKGHMQLDITIDDPKTYTAPWKLHINFTAQPTWNFGESFCVPENQQNFDNQVLNPNNGVGPAKK